MYFVCWRSSVTGETVRGSAFLWRKTADEWANHLNKIFPGRKHWVESA